MRAPFLHGTQVDNPYEAEKQFSKKEVAKSRKTMKVSKDQATKELKREVEALTSAVGYKGEVKNKAQEVMLLNSKAVAADNAQHWRDRKEQ